MRGIFSQLIAFTHRSLGHAQRHQLRSVTLVIVCWSLFAGGCQPAAETSVKQIEEYVTVRLAANGPPQQIPRQELLNPTANSPSYHSVLAIDRQLGKPAWVELEQLRKQPPTMARYIPLTTAKP